MWQYFYLKINLHYKFHKRYYIFMWLLNFILILFFFNLAHYLPRGLSSGLFISVILFRIFETLYLLSIYLLLISLFTNLKQQSNIFFTLQKSSAFLFSRFLIILDLYFYLTVWIFNFIEKIEKEI